MIIVEPTRQSAIIWFQEHIDAYPDTFTSCTLGSEICGAWKYLAKLKNIT